jgi:hypothetical protein
LVLPFAIFAGAQQPRRTKQEKGPRALGLLELSADGKARLIPITIMVDGKFYDASAYKASPVPLALWSQTVYEAEQTGVSQGLFTVGEAMRAGSNNWFGEGKWRPAGSETKPKRAAAKPKNDEDEGPPKLRRPEPETSTASPENTSGHTASAPAPPAKTPSPTPDEKKTPSGTSPNGTSPTPPASAPSTGAASSDEKPPEEPVSTSANDEDPNRPVLKRGKPKTEGVVHPGASTGVPRRPTGAAASAETKPAPPQQIPAISDAGGPDPRPYKYDLKSDEEQKYRKGMLALASDAVRAKIKETKLVLQGAKPEPPAAKPTRAAKAVQPSFDDVQFRAFDLWNTNEPVFVLSATAHMPGSPGSEGSDVSYFVSLVAKKNIYDELHKLYAGVTDARHLDETPRLELIDAVDADGDGRGELLFKRITDVGSTWGVYRAGADQLFPLFEGTPLNQ